MRTKLVLTFLLSGALFLPVQAVCMQTGDAPARTADKGKTSGEASTPPSAQDIANAKSQGLVWVNLSTRVYHKDGEFYGKTKRGKFVTEEDAKKEGFHQAQLPTATKKTTPKKGDQSGLDSSKETHVSTPPPAK